MRGMSDNEISLNKPIKMWNNIPLDSRQITPSLNELDENINYPYVGMIFYSQFEDDYYKVLSVESGYRIGRTGSIVRASSVNNVDKNMEISGYFVGEYEQYVLKGNTNTMIKKAYIDDAGYLHIVFADDQDTNVGYVIGDPGYCPQISENSDNDMETLSNLIYKLDIQYCDELTHLKKILTTENLIGPYVVNIEDQLDDDNNKTGYLVFTLNTGDTYTVGPYGIKSIELKENSDGSKEYLIITYNDGTESNLGNVRGKDGSSVNIKGTLQNKSDLPSNASKGDAYIVGKDLWFFYTSWSNVGQIVGDDGSTPDITLKYKIINPSTNDDDQRQILHIEFFNGKTLIDTPIEFRLPFSPEINIVSNTESTFKVQFVAYTNKGDRIEINSPNLKGEDGSSINIKGSIDTYTDLMAYATTANEGDGYIVDNENDTDDGHLWIYTGDTSINDSKHYMGFLDVGKIKGPTGSDGDKGDKGDDGYQVKFRISKKDDGTTWIQYCYVDKNNNEVSTYEDLIDIVEITGAAGISPEVEVIKSDDSTILKITDSTGIVYTDNLIGSQGNKGEDGQSIEIRYSNQEIQYRYFIKDSEDNKTYPYGESWNLLCTIPKITQETIDNGFKLTIGDDTYVITNGKNITLRYNENSSYIEWQYVGDKTWTSLVSINAISGSDGLSAYQIWLSLGNEGTEEDFINSLKGEQGDKGDKGETGEQGVSLKSIEFVKSSLGNTSGIAGATDTYKFIFSDGNEVSFDIANGTDGKEIELRSTESTIQWKYVTDSEWKDLLEISTITGSDGEDGKNGIDGKNIEIGNVTTNIVTDEKDVSIITSLNNSLSTDEKNVYDFTFNILKGEKGEQGDKGETGEQGIQGEKGEDGSDGREIELTVSDNSIQWKYTDESEWKDLLTIDQITGAAGKNGKDIEVGKVTTTSIESTEDPIVTVTINSSLSTDEKNVYDFSFSIPKGEKGEQGDKGETGEQGIQGEKGEDGSDGIDGKDGQDGKDASVSIIENKDNDDFTYKLDISYTNGEDTVEFTTPNLKGGINELYKIIESLPETDSNDEYDTNHIYLVLKEDNEEIVSKENNYDKYIILSKDESGNIIWEKIETTEASGNILVVCDELPDIETASTNFIYCLLTPSYERGLNIGLLDKSSINNKNYYEEWIVIVDEETGAKSWELLAPQLYRISEKMIDYVWDINETYTVYDDWDDTTDISDYQKDFGDITPLSNFVYRIEGSNLILVKYIGSGDVYLNIAPKYKIGDKVYTVTELDGTYYENKTYYQIDSEGNTSVYNFDTSSFSYDGNNIEITQTVLTGPQVYSLYIADTVTKLTRVLINTSNIPKYHIPEGIETIGDYAFYSSANQTMVFEKLSADGKTAVQVGFESSNIKYIGEYACACTTNMRMITDSGTTTNYLTTPAGLKKISNYAFYGAGQIAHVDTRKSSNLFVGKGAFERSNLSAVQYLSPTTYYTDSAFLGYTALYHDTRVVGSGGMYFYSQDTIGYNYNDTDHTQASETAVLNVTLNTVDPSFE
jgi:hypothetical protein